MDFFQYFLLSIQICSSFKFINFRIFLFLQHLYMYKKVLDIIVSLSSSLAADRLANFVSIGPSKGKESISAHR